LIIGQAGRRNERYRRQSAFPVDVAAVRTQRFIDNRRSGECTGRWFIRSRLSGQLAVPGALTFSAPPLSVSLHFTFGQPSNRITALTVEDVVVNDGKIGIRLGQGVSPVPPPFAAMVHELRPRFCGSGRSSWASICWVLGVERCASSCSTVHVADLLG